MLADTLHRSLRAFPGAPEREQIDAFLTEAKRFRLGDTATRSIARTVASAPRTIERNIDVLQLPADPFWLEFEHAARCMPENSGNTSGVEQDLADGGITPTRVGALFVTRPDQAGVAVVTAWEREETPGVDGIARMEAHHSPAVMHWSWDNFRWLGHHARHYFSADGHDAAQRLMDTVVCDIPENLRTELDHTGDFVPSASQDAASQALSAKRETTGEALFLMAACLLLNARNCRFTYPSDLRDENSVGVDVAPMTRQTPMGRLLKQPGFARDYRNRLLWRPFTDTERV